MVTDTVHLTGFIGTNGGTQSDAVGEVDVPKPEFGSAALREQPSSSVVEGPPSPSQLRERAAGIRWAIRFVRDDWRIDTLHQLAEQLQQTAMLLEREEETDGDPEPEATPESLCDEESLI
ncbi:MAG TPA: hypothetical protein VL614_14520 [Acetobacteraceae bacterium]|jgi:hypothetical protein|nr:hypothetical protein [Acetobacteraceae bacterium]